VVSLTLLLLLVGSVLGLAIHSIAVVTVLVLLVACSLQDNLLITRKQLRLPVA
jgi:hypothetical protein